MVEGLYDKWARRSHFRRRLSLLQSRGDETRETFYMNVEELRDLLETSAWAHVALVSIERVDRVGDGNGRRLKVTFAHNRQPTSLPDVDTVCEWLGQATNNGIVYDRDDATSATVMQQ